MSAPAITGGCQCGAVRYRIAGVLEDLHICHCRMCQKAAGNFFMPLGRAALADFVLTRGALAWFDSSDLVQRGFCRNCGTPLIYRNKTADTISVTLGSLDDVGAAKPAHQCAPQAKLAWFGELDGLPWEATDPSPWYAAVAASSHQHPDHDTPEWPSKDVS